MDVSRAEYLEEAHPERAARLHPASIALAGAALALVALAYVALQIDSAKAALLAAAGSVVCLAAALAYPLRLDAVTSRLSEWRGVLLLAPSMVAAALVALVVDRPAVSDQWQWITLWLAALAVVPLVHGVRIDARGTAAFLSRHRYEIAGIVALVGLAAVARFVRIGSLPSPFSGDEGFFSLTSLVVVEGNTSNPFAVAAQSAPIYLYYLGSFHQVFGVSPEAARAASALLGVVSVFVTYFFLRELFNRTVAICGTLFLAVYAYHLQFSRQAMPNIFDPLFIPIILLFTYRAMKYGRNIDYAMAGLTFGLTIYGWVSARLIPLEIGALLVWWLLTQRSMPANWLRGGVVAVAALFIAAAPFAWRSYHNPDVFNARINQVGIFQKKVDGEHTWYQFEREKGRTPAEIFGKQLRYSLETVFLTKDQWNFYGADVPLIGTGVLPILVIGLVWAMWRIREPRYFLLILMLFAPIVTGGVLTIPDRVIPASSSRLLAIIPAVAALVGLGAERVGVLASSKPNVRLMVSLALVMGVAYPSMYYYFRVYDSEGFSDQVTREINTFVGEVQDRVPPGTEVHFIQNGLWNLGHPALDFGLREYPVFEVSREGDLLRFQNPREVDVRSGPVAVLFVGDANFLFDAVMQQCPGGRPTRLPIQPEPEFSRALYMVELPTLNNADQTQRHPCFPP